MSVMNKVFRSPFILVLMILIVLLPACGQAQVSGVDPQAAGTTAGEQVDIGQAGGDSEESKESGNGAPKPEGGATGGLAGEMAEMLNNPKLPANYTYEIYQEIEPYREINESFERCTIKDNRIRIDSLPYKGEDKDKIVQTILYDSLTKKVQMINWMKKFGREGTDNQPESWQRYDLAYTSKQYTSNFLSPDNPLTPTKTEESIDGNPCIVFEFKNDMEGEGYLSRFFISKEYNVILRIYTEESGYKKTMTNRNFKAGSVTDDMLNLAIPGDITMEKQ